MNSAFARWRASFYTGLAIVLPAFISLAIVKWLFGTVANITDPLLFFLPNGWTHQPDGPMYWWWSLFAVLLAIGLVAAIGRMARNYIGNKMIQAVDLALLRVPIMNKIYAAIKQVNEAFTSSNKTSFKQVVLVQFPAPGIYAVGFLTGVQPAEVRSKLNESLLSVFVPTTPNPTGGFVLLVPERQVTRLDMSVAEGIKFVLSLGSVTPEYLPAFEPAAIAANSTFVSPAVSPKGVPLNPVIRDG
jgi:uncharacterized membrane protein